MLEINEKNLRDVYLLQNKTVLETATIFNVSKRKMTRILEKYKICKYAERITKREKPITEEFLREKYYNEELSIYQIAELCETKHTTIRCLFKKFNIKVKSKKFQLEKYISDDKLMDEYLNGKSTNDIANEYCIKSPCHLTRRLKELGVIIRGSEFMTIKKKKCKQFQRKRGQGDIDASYWGKVKHNAKYREIEINITALYAWNVFEAQGGKCAMSGVNLNFAKTINGKKNCEQTASLDRIDSSKGYIHGNIQWVHKAVNRIKGQLHNVDIYKWSKLIHENLKDKYDVR